MKERTLFLAIIGLPNVGKSTLFNRICGEMKAVVEDLPGVTRDRNYARVERFSIPFVLVDTGGFARESEDPLQKQVLEQTLLAVQEADIVFAVFDGDAGVRPGDEEVVSLLRGSGKQVYFLVNKVDGMEQEAKAAEFYALGVNEILPVSALRGHHVSEYVERALSEWPRYKQYRAAWKDHQEQLAQTKRELLTELDLAAAQFIPAEDLDDEDLLDEEEGEERAPEQEPIFAPVFVPGEDDAAAYKAYEAQWRLREKDLPAEREARTIIDDGEEAQPTGAAPEVALPVVRVAIIGRPNVGKSTLLNTITGEQRAIVSDISGTTRDSLEVPLTRDGQEFLLTDTAGLRKQGRVADTVEQFSAMRALRAIADCDVAVVVLDAFEGPTAQDARIVGLAHEEGRGIVLAVNKWDLVKKDHRTVQEYKLRIRETFKFAPYAPIVFISAKTGRRCPWVLQTALEVARERMKRIPTGELNRVLERAVKRSPLPMYRGRPLKLYFGAQVDVAPPRFILFFNHPKAVHFSNLRHIKNELRDKFGFEGSDIKLMTKKRVPTEKQL